MRTEDLIATLAADARRSGKPVPPTILPATIASMVLVAAVFVVLVGAVRPDIAEAIGSIRFLMKFAVTLSLAAAAYVVLNESAYPEGIRARGLFALAVPSAVMASCVAFELWSIPADLVRERLVGSNSLVCLVYVPLMGIFPLGLLILALRRAAPARPALSGLAAGLLAGAMAATAYAAYCPDDSPLFVATWYTMAIGGLALLGGFAARTTLRW